MKKKKPHGQGELVQGKAGNIDAYHFTLPIPEIQAQSPVFLSITPCLLGEYNGGAA